MAFNPHGNNRRVKRANETRAYCWASGLIEFTTAAVPSGAILIALGPDKIIREYIEGVARHGYRTEDVDGRPTKVAGSDQLLVPGVPEAEMLGNDPVEELSKFKNWIRQNPPAGVIVL